MTARKTLKITIPESETTREELEAIERDGEQTRERPKALLLREIHVAPQVFQWRLENDNLINDREQIKDLARALNSQGEPLEPLLVTPIGSKFYVIDGHHRLAAYLSTGWTRKVPVEVFEGSLKDAWTKALECNNRNKLPMTLEARREAAWKLNLERTPEGKHVYSKVQIRKLAGVSDGHIAQQRRVLEALGDEAVGLTWRQANSRQWKQESDQPFDADNWKEAKAREIADKILASVGTNLLQNPDILAMALEMISPGLAVALVEEWAYIAKEVVETIRDDEEEHQQLVAEGKALDI